MKHYTINSVVVTREERSHGNNGYKKVPHFDVGTFHILLTIYYWRSKGLFASNLILYSCKILYLLIVSYWKQFDHLRLVSYEQDCNVSVSTQLTTIM
jgi:Uncharacterized protein conserved in bacteria